MLNFADRAWNIISPRPYLLMTQRLHPQTTPQPGNNGTGDTSPATATDKNLAKPTHPPGTAGRMFIVTERRHTPERGWRHDSKAMA